MPGAAQQAHRHRQGSRPRGACIRRPGADGWQGVTQHRPGTSNVAPELEGVEQRPGAFRESCSGPRTRRFADASRRCHELCAKACARWLAASPALSTATPVARMHRVRGATKTPFLGVGCRHSGMRRACFAPRRSRVAVEKRQPYGNERPARRRQLADDSAQVVDLLVGRARLERATNGLKVRCSTD